MYEVANVHKIENDCTSKFHEAKTEILTCQEKRKTTFTRARARGGGGRGKCVPATVPTGPSENILRELSSPPISQVPEIQLKLSDLVGTNFYGLTYVPSFQRTEMFCLNIDL